MMKFDAGTIGTFSGAPAPPPRPAETSQDSGLISRECIPFGGNSTPAGSASKMGVLKGIDGTLPGYVTPTHSSAPVPADGDLYRGGVADLNVRSGRGTGEGGLSPRHA